jgi:hypothetical protein
MPICVAISWEPSPQLPFPPQFLCLCAGEHIARRRPQRIGSRRSASISARMVVAEIALSLVLVVAAALLVQTMIKLRRQDPGFRSDHLFTAHIFVPPARYVDPADITRFCDQLGRRLRAIPGVIDASVTGVYPTSM